MWLVSMIVNFIEVQSFRVIQNKVLRIASQFRKKKQKCGQNCICKRFIIHTLHLSSVWLFITLASNSELLWW